LLRAFLAGTTYHTSLICFCPSAPHGGTSHSRHQSVTAPVTNCTSQLLSTSLTFYQSLTA
jgi:hypothetical protein